MGFMRREEEKGQGWKGRARYEQSDEKKNDRLQGSDGLMAGLLDGLGVGWGDPRRVRRRSGEAMGGWDGFEDGAGG